MYGNGARISCAARHVSLFRKGMIQDNFFPGTGDINWGKGADAGKGLVAFPITDEDRSIPVLQRVLVEIHERFFNSGKTASTKEIIPTLKSSLANMRLYFTSLIPLAVPIVNADIYNLACSFGASVSEVWDDTVTHVVAGRVTEKCLDARGKCEVVWGSFVFDSCYMFESVDVKEYRVFGDKINGGGRRVGVNEESLGKEGDEVFAIGNIGGDDWDEINKELEAFEEDSESELSLGEDDECCMDEGIDEEEDDWINDLEDSMETPAKKMRKDY
jgi:hypothetical protein